MKRNLQKGILVTSACAAFLLGNVQQAYAVAADAIEIVQQNKKIAGIVVDQNGEAVIGANVIQKGTTNGTITDIDGKFTLEVPAKAVLTVSFIGYQSQDVALKGNETQLTVTLKDDTEVLDEVVVVGYGTMKKRDLSGAVSQIKSDDLMKGNPTDLSQGLAGKVAGVQILPVRSLCLLWTEFLLTPVPLRPAMPIRTTITLQTLCRSSIHTTFKALKC